MNDTNRRIPTSFARAFYVLKDSAWNRTARDPVLLIPAGVVAPDVHEFYGCALRVGAAAAGWAAGIGVDGMIEVVSIGEANKVAPASRDISSPIVGIFVGGPLHGETWVLPPAGLNSSINVQKPPMFSMRTLDADASLSAPSEKGTYTVGAASVEGVRAFVFKGWHK